MTQFYLYFNSVLYLLLAVWNTANLQSAATRLGYLTMSDRGRSEYLVVYGGLQIGLTILFYLLARNTSDLSLGLRISVGIYAPIVLYRIVTGLMNWTLSCSTLGAIGLESLLLIAAIWLLYSSST